MYRIKNPLAKDGKKPVQTGVSFGIKWILLRQTPEMYRKNGAIRLRLDEIHRKCTDNTGVMRAA
jgi:hypothetical protein